MGTRTSFGKGLVEQNLLKLLVRMQLQAQRTLKMWRMYPIKGKVIQVPAQFHHFWFLAEMPSLGQSKNSLQIPGSHLVVSIFLKGDYFVLLIFIYNMFFLLYYYYYYYLYCYVKLGKSLRIKTWLMCVTIRPHYLNFILFLFLCYVWWP